MDLMKRNLSSLGGGRLDITPKRVDIQTCLITCSAGSAQNPMTSDLASAPERFWRCPVGTWVSYLGGGHDSNIGMRVTFFEDGSGTMEEWGFDELYDPAYVSEPKFQWRNLGERKIEITHRGQVRAVDYDFKITKNEYGLEELRMFEPGAKPDEHGDVGFWRSPFSLIYREPDRPGIIERLKKTLGAA